MPLLLATESLELLALVHGKQVGLSTEPAILREIGVSQSPPRRLALLALLLCYVSCTPT